MSHLLWADDLILLALNVESLQKQLNWLYQFVSKWELQVSGVTLGMGAPLLAPPSPIWRPLSPQEAVLLNVSFKIKSQQNSENDCKNLKKCTFVA